MKNSFIFALLLALSHNTFCLAQGERHQTAEQLSPPSDIVSYPMAFVTGELEPIWSRGYLIAYRDRTLPGQTMPNLRVFDRKGNLVNELRLWIDGASLVHIYDVAASSDGRLGVVGTVVDSSGSTAWIFADISLTNERPTRIIHTSPFGARAFDFAPDGSVWLLGARPGPGPSLKDAPDHFIVEHLSRDGVLEGEYVKRSAIACTGHPGVGGLVKVQASDDRIGLFLQGCNYWVELKPNGELIGQWHWHEKISLDGKTIERRVLTAALTSQGELYAYMQETNGKDATGGLFRLDRSKNDWIPMNTAAMDQAGAPGIVQGADGDDLVFFTAEERVVWAKATVKDPFR
jgi:hypothetical protein